MNNKLKVALISSALIFACGGYTWGIPALVNIQKNKTLIENKIFEISGYKIDIGNPKLSMGAFPSVWIETDNISVLNDDNTKALNIDNPKIHLRLFPMLWGKIEIPTIKADKEEINLVYSKDSKFMLGQYPITLPEGKKKLSLSKISADIGEYNIALDDKLNGKNLNLKSNNFSHLKYVANKQVSLNTTGTFSKDGYNTDIFTDINLKLPIDRVSENKIKINANIKDFDLSSISDYTNTLSKGTIKKLNGIVNIDASTKSDDFRHKKISLNMSTNNLEIIGKDQASSIIYKKPLTTVIDFNTFENGIDIKNFQIDSDKIHTQVNGKLTNIGHKKTPRYNINAKVTKTRLEDIVAILPWSETFPPDFNLYKLKKYVYYGNGEGSLNFKGQGIRPDVYGNVKLGDTYLIHPIKGAPANADVDLDFSGKKMFVNVFVPVAPNQSVTVKGHALIDGSRYSELDISSTDSVPLAQAEEVLNPLHEILKFQLGPVPMMTVSGFGNIKIRSAGKKVDPHIWGEIHFRNATAAFNEIHNLVVNNASGEVLFDDTKVTFKTYHSYLNGLPIEIKGDCIMLGKLNVYVNSKGQNVKKLLNAINSSPILTDVQKVVKPFKNPEGIADVFLHIYGITKDTEEIVFNQDLFAKGKINLHNSKTTLESTFIPLTSINGIVNFNQYDSDYDLTGNIRNSKVHVWGTGKNNSINLKAQSEKFELRDIFDFLHPDMPLPFKKELGKITSSFAASYSGAVENSKLDYNKIKADGKFLSNMSSADKIKLDGGTFTINNGYLKTSNLKGLFDNNPFTLSFSAKDLDKENVTISEAKFDFKNFDISAVEGIKNQIKLPKQAQKQINNFTDFNGRIDISGNVKNNNINANTDLSDISFIYKPLDALIKIHNGKANIKGNTLYLDKINSGISSMPIFLNGKISNIFSPDPSLNLFVSSKLSQQFFDRFVNSKSVYPVKTKGDINFYSKLGGTLNAISAKSTLNLKEDASIYYMGATLAGVPTGDINAEGMSTNPVSILSDVIIQPNKIKINSFNYNQIITSQNKKKSIQNQLRASGEISILKNNILSFKNLKIKTSNPTNARIFNILFKKPTIKQGVFTSDLTINGTSEYPYILGLLNIRSVDIPVMNSTIKDINLDFQKDYIHADSKGIILTNDIFMKAKILNKPAKQLVVESFNIQMDELDLNTVTSSLSDYEADKTRSAKLKSENQTVTPTTIIVKNGEINADKILIKKAIADNFTSHMTLNSEQILDIDKFAFDMAKGKVDGNIKYDLKNSSGFAQMNINNADAQIIAENFFDMEGQVFGNVTGSLNAKCSGITSLDCVNSLSGSGNFEVTNGRMPKLGSLEYLLKAGNLLTGGITAVSINGIMDLITPLKTGQFNSIKGDIHVTNGIADQINVYSDGNDLNMYMTGSYNLSTLVADMEIYGSLSKNFSSLLGKIANISLNTLFNTIPGVKINEINPASTSNILKIPSFNKDNVLRVFKAEIYGDINGSNYVKSFKWIKD